LNLSKAKPMFKKDIITRFKTRRKPMTGAKEQSVEKLPNKGLLEPKPISRRWVLFSGSRRKKKLQSKVNVCGDTQISRTNQKRSLAQVKRDPRTPQ